MSIHFIAAGNARSYFFQPENTSRPHVLLSVTQEGNIEIGALSPEQLTSLRDSLANLIINHKAFAGAHVTYDELDNQLIVHGACAGQQVETVALHLKECGLIDQFDFDFICDREKIRGGRGPRPGPTGPVR